MFVSVASLQISTLICTISCFELVFAFLDTLYQIAALQLFRGALFGPTLLFEVLSKQSGRYAVGSECGLRILIFTFAAAEEVADGANDFGKCVKFVGDREFEALLDFAFELVYFFLVLPLELAGAFRCLAVHASATV